MAVLASCWFGALKNLVRITFRFTHWAASGGGLAGRPGQPLGLVAQPIEVKVVDALVGEQVLVVGAQNGLLLGHEVLVLVESALEFVVELLEPELVQLDAGLVGAACGGDGAVELVCGEEGRGGGGGGAGGGCDG